MNLFSKLFRSRDKPKDYLSVHWPFLFGGTAAGINVNERTSMQVTAVYACVRILSEAIASLPLNVYTLNSVYYCHIDDCKRRKQAPFDILPEPVRKIANEKLYPLVNELVEDNTIILAFDINDSNLNFVD